MIRLVLALLGVVGFTLWLWVVCPGLVPIAFLVWVWIAEPMTWESEWEASKGA